MQRFSKYQGAGNDFILIEDEKGSFPLERVAPLCALKTGIGADGLILLQKSSSADVRMRMFNADGSEPSLCGNGLRCLVQYLLDQGSDKTHFQIETARGILKAKVQEGKVFTQLVFPQIFAWEQPFETDQGQQIGYGIDTGVPHLVFFGPFDSHLAFTKQVRKQRDCNVNWIEESEDNTLFVRTFERGVEAETLACGTGAAAAAYVLAKREGLEGALTVRVRSGERLQVVVGEELYVSGPAERVFDGYLFS